MASKYKVVSAFSPKGDALHVPVSWVVDNPASDLLVLIVPPNGVARVLNSWQWNPANSSVSVFNSQGFSSYSVYIFRCEFASMLAQFNSSSEIDIHAIINQLEKLVRINEQLQEKEKCILQAPDTFSGAVPVKSARAGYILSFNEQGDAECIWRISDINTIQGICELASEAALLAAKNSAIGAKDSISAQGKSELAQKKAEAACKNAQEFADKTEEFTTQSSEILTEIRAIRSEVLTALSAVRAIKNQIATMQNDVNVKYEKIQRVFNMLFSIYDENGNLLSGQFGRFVSIRTQEGGYTQQFEPGKYHE